MDLPFIKKTPKQTNSNSGTHEYFFAIQIGPEIVKSAIWSVYNAKPQVLSVGSPARWDTNSQDSLLTASDQSVSDTLARLDPLNKLNPEKVIFGLTPDWVVNDKIVPQKIGLIKALSTKLSLKPVGFVTTSQALIQHIHSLEGVPPTTILLGFWPSILELTVVRLGKSEGTFLINRSANPLEDVIEGLSRYGHLDMFPSRMLLYDSGTDLEEIRQLLLSHPWLSPQKRLPFIHFPKIETLPGDFSIRSIALSGGSEVAHALGLISSSEETVSEPEVQTESSSLGFTQHSNPEPPAETPSEVYIPLPTPPSQSRSAKKFTLPNISFSWPSRTPMLIGVIVFFATVTISLVLAYWFLPKSKIILTVNPQNISTQFSLTTDSKAASLDLDKSIIPAEFLDTTVSAEKSADTTGSKTIGEKATATVTIFNGTDGAYKFDSNTLLTSPSGLKYVTTESVTVASASGVVPNLEYGKAKVKAQAQTIGPEYNIAASTNFRVGSFSQKDIAATSDVAFTGGTSQKVRAVSKEDMTKLRSALMEDLSVKAKDDLQKKLGSDKFLIDKSLTTQISSEEYDHKSDEPADSLKLNLGVSAKAMVVNNSDFDQALENKLLPLIPEGFELTKDIKKSITIKKADSTGATIQIDVQASLLPKLDENSLIKSLVGRPPQIARDNLSSIPGISQIDFIFTPSLPKFLTVLPHLPQNIHIEITAKK